ERLEDAERVVHRGGRGVDEVVVVLEDRLLRARRASGGRRENDAHERGEQEDESATGHLFDGQCEVGAASGRLTAVRASAIALSVSGWYGPRYRAARSTASASRGRPAERSNSPSCNHVAGFDG